MPSNSHNTISRSAQCYPCASIWLSSKPWNNRTSKKNHIRNTHSIWASGILQRNIPRCISSLRSSMARWPHAQNQNTLAWLHSQASWILSVRTQRYSTWPHPTNQEVAKLGTVPGAQLHPLHIRIADQHIICLTNSPSHRLNGTLTGQCSQHILQCLQSQLHKLLP